MDRLGVPVVGEATQHDTILRGAGVEAERPGADRVQAELVAGSLGRFGRDHDTGAIGELGQKLRRRRLQVELDREGIDDLDAVDRADLAAAHTALGGQVARQLVFGGFSSELFAVLELHAGAQMDDQVRRVLPLVAYGKLRHDVQLGVDVEQLVAQAGEHDAPDIGGAEGGIEQVRVLPQADMQDIVLCDGRASEAKGTRGGEHESAHDDLLDSNAGRKGAPQSIAFPGELRGALPPYVLVTY